ncbi:hypothetical protein CRUP_022411, partial [Coryphaenoides rupestris]
PFAFVLIAFVLARRIQPAISAPSQRSSSPAHPSCAVMVVGMVWVVVVWVVVVMEVVVVGMEVVVVVVVAVEVVVMVMGVVTCLSTVDTLLQQQQQQQQQQRSQNITLNPAAAAAAASMERGVEWCKNQTVDGLLLSPPSTERRPSNRAQPVSQSAGQPASQQPPGARVVLPIKRPSLSDKMATMEHLGMRFVIVCGLFTLIYHPPTLTRLHSPHHPLSSPKVRSKCAPTFFACANGIYCIIGRFRCNGFADCPDGSDEENCSNPLVCSESRFKCRNGRCVDRSFLCNSQDNCQDNSDEEHCLTTAVAPGQDFVTLDYRLRYYPSITYAVIGSAVIFVLVVALLALVLHHQRKRSVLLPRGVRRRGVGAGGVGGSSHHHHHHHHPLLLSRLVILDHGGHRGGQAALRSPDSPPGDAQYSRQRAAGTQGLQLLRPPWFDLPPPPYLEGGGDTPSQGELPRYEAHLEPPQPPRAAPPALSAPSSSSASSASTARTLPPAPAPDRSSSEGPRCL